LSRRKRRSAASASARPSDTWSAEGQSAASVPSGSKNQIAVPICGQGDGNRRSRSRPKSSAATTNLNARGTRITTPNGIARHVFEIRKSSRNRAGRTTPVSVQIWWMYAP
jgi:hypothetical protein